mgnify:CR=1 FL=1
MLKSWLLFFISSTAWAGYLYPEQVHIAWTENEYEMSVTYVTLFNVPWTQVAYRPYHCDGHEFDGFTYVDGSMITFDAGEVKTRNIYVHTARMPNILRECSYEYQVGTTLLWSDAFYFNGITPDYNEPYETLGEQHRMLIFGRWGVGPTGATPRP